MFKAFTKKYDFDKDVLSKDMPSYIVQPIADWIAQNLNQHSKRRSYGYSNYITSDYKNELQITLREVFSEELPKLLNKLFSDTELLTNYLAFALQKHCYEAEALALEKILATGGSGYAVEVKKHKIDQSRTRVECNLIERVPTIVKQQARAAIADNEKLSEAWQRCYQHNPDYEKTVSLCCDVLEALFGKKYWPQDPKPQLGKFVAQFQTKPDILNYDGNNLIDPKNLLTDLLRELPNIRGQHTAGKGRTPTAEEARFALHLTITIWNLHH